MTHRKGAQNDTSVDVVEIERAGASPPGARADRDEQDAAEPLGQAWVRAPNQEGRQVDEAEQGVRLADGS